MADELIRFIFEDTDIRGEWVQLERSYRDCLANHHHAPGVNRLIGEFMAAGALLAATLKFDGMVVLQARSEGEVPLIMAEATSDQGLRAIVRGAEKALSDDFTVLLRNGQLAITIDPAQGARYQGVVPMEAHTLAECLEDYFSQSEQLPTRVWLAVDEHRVAGLFLQELPSRTTPAVRAQQWDHLLALAQTVRPDEMLTLTGDEVLHRLFHQEPLQLLQRDPLAFRCSCSLERTETMLFSIGRDELENILEEQGEVNVTCEFCNQNYQFDSEAVARLFAANSSDQGRAH